MAAAAFWASIIGVLILSPAEGQVDEAFTPMFDKSFRELTPTLSRLSNELMGDTISPDDGSLSFYHVDVSLPGNSDLPVQFARSTGTGVPGSSHALGDWAVEVPRMETFVYSDNPAGSESWQANRCGGPGAYVPPDTDRIYEVYLSGGGTSLEIETLWGTEYYGGVRLNIPGENAGYLIDEHPSTNPQLASAEYVTNQFWKVDCLPGQASDLGDGFIATDPNGTRYRFDVLRYHLREISEFHTTWSGVQVQVQGNNHEPVFRAVMYASRVEDVHGNWVEYSYNAYGPTKIEANDGRVIDITYAAVGSSTQISQVQANGRTWDYHYNSTGHLSTLRLDRVELPDGRQWSFDLNFELPGMDLFDTVCGAWLPTHTITHPSGVQGVFESTIIDNGIKGAPWGIPPSPFWDLSPTCTGTTPGSPRYTTNYAISEKRLQDGTNPAAIWTYEYEEDDGSRENQNPSLSATKKRTFTAPDGVVSVYHVNREFNWRKGLIERIEVYSDSSQSALIQVLDFEYDQGPFIGYYLASTTGAFEPYQHAIREDRREITQNGETYLTETEYNNQPTSSAYSFGFPTRVERSSTLGGGSRITTTSYAHNTSQWVLGLPSVVRLNGVEVDRFGYNSDGDVVWRNQFGARVADFDYNADGTLAWHEDALNRRTTASNWKRGIPQLVTRPDATTLSRIVDDNGWVTSLTDPNGTTTGYGHNSMGWLTLINRPAGFADTTVSYTGLGSGLTQTVNHGALRTIRTLDGFHRPTRIEQRAISGGGGSIFTRFEYDELGRTVFASFPSTGSNPATGVETTYDGLGRVIETRENVAPFATITTQFLTDNRIRVTDPSGNVTTTWRSGWGGPDDGVPVRIDHPLGLTTEMTHNVFDNLLTARQFGTHSGFTVDETQSWTYDARQRLCRHVTPETGATQYTYDAAGQVLTVARGMSPTAACGTAGSSARTVHGYDLLGRLTSVNYPDASPDVAMSYDANGNLMTADRGATAWTYTYDVMNQLTEEELVVDGRTYETRHAYETDGRYRSIRTPSSRLVFALPDGHGRARGVRWNSFDYASGGTYHPSGRLQSLNFGNGLAQTHVFNSRHQIIDVDISGGGVTAFDHSYIYDANGRVSDIIVHMLPSESRSFTYDALGRLSTASGPWGSGSYSYDLLNNIRSKTLGVETVEIQYSAANR
ncbi:MAG: hypothetical protein AAFX09_11615, partial [Pseudomonadota bacterium]